MAAGSSDARWISGEDSRQIVHRMRNAVDAVVVGVGTVKADDPQLTCRIPRGRNPWRIVLDSRLSIPLSARILRQVDPANYHADRTRRGGLEKLPRPPPQAKVSGGQTIAANRCRCSSACLSIGDIRTLSSGTRVTEAIDKHRRGQPSGREDPSRKASCCPSDERVAGNWASFCAAFWNPRDSLLAISGR